MLPALFGAEDPTLLRITEAREMLAFAYKMSGYKGKATLDDDLARMLAACGTDEQGRVDAAGLCRGCGIPEWREHLEHGLEDLFWAAAHDSGLGYPHQLHRTTFHDGRPGTEPAMGTPDINMWICGPKGTLGYGGK